MNDEPFDPQEMAQFVGKLKAEGRMPSFEEFVRAMIEVREEVRGTA